ncbi:MAG TPA: response regulator [Bryobacteraceae bacterium]|nr:response regulator [Bryobacteraceae bacterium]
MITILNVDDNAALRYARTQVLRQAGYGVLEATTGEEAMAIVNDAHPALVLLDVNLPDISGFDVCRRIKRQPQAAGIPVLHISATAVEDKDLITGLQAADAYVIEPVQPEMLLAFVRALLRGSELLRQWVAVFDALADGVALLSSEGAVLRCNSAFCRLLGKRIGEVLGRKITDVIAGSPLAGIEHLFERSVETHHTETLECAFGERTYRFSFHLATVRGNIAGAIYIVSDVTEERRAAREREEAFTLLRALTDSAPIGFAFFDRDMRYRLVNKELAKIDGVSVEAHIGSRPENIVPRMADWIRLEFQRVIDTGQPVLGREWIEGSLDDPRTMRCWLRSWYPVHSADGSLLGVGATVVETTELRRSEKARQDLERRMLDAQKLESVGLLAGGIAHDFNNLLTGILGNASLAKESAQPGSTLFHYLDEIVHASKRAAHLTKQMLAYSGKGQFILEEMDLSREIQEVVRLVQSSISKKISVIFDLSHELPPVRADKGEIQQVIMNLVVNAAEAIGDSAGLLIIRNGIRDLAAEQIREVHPGNDIVPGRYAYIEITDSGCGMNEQTRLRIFDPFFTTKFTGRGLGLAAVGGIVRGHKGGIQVKSSPGKGSTFVVYLPAGDENARKLPAEIPQETPSTALAGGTVLVVDDEALVLGIAKSALERAGWTVLAADSGPHAIEMLQRYSDQVSIVLLDLSMPGMSGLEALPVLRKISPDVPVLVSSGYGEAETLRLFSGHRIAGFLQKPYTVQELVEHVKMAASPTSKLGVKG